MHLGSARGRTGCFNPHSSFRTSATDGFRNGERLSVKSFNPHSSFRTSATVSSVMVGPWLMFQSSLELSHECNESRGEEVRYLGGFQSSLELSHECNGVHVRVSRDTPRVSILTRAFARVQPWGLRDRGIKREFQSSLELSHECNVRPASKRVYHSEVSILTRAFARVQQRAVSVLARRFEGFNPHSSFRTSATCPSPSASTASTPVSILTRAFARVQPRRPVRPRG